MLSAGGGRGRLWNSLMSSSSVWVERVRDTKGRFPSILTLQREGEDGMCHAHVYCHSYPGRLVSLGNRLLCIAMVTDMGSIRLEA